MAQSKTTLLTWLKRGTWTAAILWLLCRYVIPAHVTYPTKNAYWSWRASSKTLKETHLTLWNQMGAVAHAGGCLLVLPRDANAFLALEKNRDQIQDQLKKKEYRLHVGKARAVISWCHFSLPRKE